MFVAFFLALLFGLVSAFLPAWFVVSVLVVPAVLVLLLVRPEYALLALVALVCDLVHPALVPRVPFLGGSIAAGDATLLILTVYALWLFAAQAGKVSRVPVAGGRMLASALALFGASLLVAVLVSLYIRELAPAVVLGETRDLLYLLALPIAVVVLREPERQQRFVVGFVVLGCLFAVGQVLQGLFNVPIFGTAGMSTLETLGYREYSTTRTNTHGLSVIIFSLMLVAGAYVLGLIRRPLFMPVFGLLLTGILLTFGRTTFVVVAVCLFVVVAWLNVRKLPRFLLMLGAFMAVAATLGLIFKPASVEAVVYRMTSIGAELDYGYSAGWRVMEVTAMVPHIQKHPMTGIGLGADYKGTSGSAATPELNRYIHNAYLYMAGKMGLPALGFFLVSMAAIFLIGRRLARSEAQPWVRLVGAAGAATMIRFVTASVTEPHLMSDHGVVNIAIAGALVYLAAQRAGVPVARPLPTGRPGAPRFRAW